MPRTPFALISDLHANLEALEAVLADIDKRGFPEIVCTGDLVGYGPNPNEVVDLVMARARTVTAGNHDWAVLNRAYGFSERAREAIDYHRELMEPKFYHLFGKTRERWDFLESLPKVVEADDLQFVHGSLRDPLMEYVFGDRHRLFRPEQLDELFPMVKWICFCGHTHFPVVIRDDKLCWVPTDQQPSFTLERDHKYIVNVGSVGQPRDRDPRACYASFDGKTVTFYRVPYDVEKTRQKILAIDAMEKYLAERLLKGE